ncbi:hypothetical protein EEJ42_11635 [Streptomyces botrytidirepellens]|uniref:Uncharacterized protein n=1 Tax=Streptomyces botrytidirepellens TaxID=2486417 RepID=A0A3M8WGQ5_9ACTN|nr:hypothetical protein EEJ42_11635 [Streptomyces botrytidirepellens]
MLRGPFRAEYTVDVMTFVYWKDDIAHQFAQALAERTRTGGVGIAEEWCGNTPAVGLACRGRPLQPAYRRPASARRPPTDTTGRSARAATSRTELRDVAKSGKTTV